MGINKNIVSKEVAVVWGGGEVATIRALTPNAISTILVKEGQGLIDLFKAFEDMDFKNVDLNNTDAVAEMVMSRAPEFLMKVANDAPRFLATVIAVATGEEDEVDFVQKEFSFPLQFECLMQIASATFVGPEAFKAFLGNVAALASTVTAMTSAPKTKNPQRPTPED